MTDPTGAAGARTASRVGNGIAVAVLALAALVWLWRQDGLGAPDVGVARWAAAAFVVTAYAALVAVVAVRAGRAARPVADDVSGTVLVAFATQTGFAEEVARDTAAALEAAGHRVHLSALAQVDAAMLATTGVAFLVVATYGDGEPPDLTRRFARDVTGRAASLDGLRFGLLALGDRTYAGYCGFARDVESWLLTSGARPLFAAIDVDNGAPASIAAWHAAVGRWAGGASVPAASRFAAWTLVERRLANPGSVGLPTYHLAFEPADGAMPAWEAGDIALVRLPDGHQREYSIASLPDDRRLELLVRRSQRPDGRIGVGAEWLTATLAPGATTALLIRANRGFRLEGVDAATPLLLIGNGTGIAGLRAHLKARVAAGASRNWLVFGERREASDHYYRDELRHWTAMDLLARTTYAFSRDGPDVRYVQDRLLDERATVAAWIADGAVVLVCGSAVGMASGVDAALRRIVGDAAVDDLTAAGRYRRDVY